MIITRQKNLIHRRIDGPQETAQLEQRRAAKGRVPKKAPKQLPRWFYPVAQERDYEKFTTRIISEYYSLVKKDFLRSGLYVQLKNGEQLLRSDAYADDITEVLARIIIDMQNRGLNDFVISGRLTQIFNNTQNFNKRQWDKILRAGFGVAIEVNEPWLPSEQSNFVNQGSELIESLTQEQIKRTRQTITQGVQQGKTVKQVTDEIVRSENIAYSRARLIARDQIGKANGRLTELRQTQAGVKKYIWRSSDDSRVRPNHQSKDDKVFEWKNPPADTGHPGMDFQCRCWAEPDFDDLYATLDEGES